LISRETDPFDRRFEMFIFTGVVAVMAAVLALGPAPGTGGTLDGYVLERPPPGVGQHVSDHAYEWGDDPAETVAFHSRVWERGPDAAGGYHVDLTVAVLRGKRLSDPAALRAFMAEYLERDAATWRPRTFTGRPGYDGPDDAFFLDRPGVAVYARLERPGSDHADLIRFMEGVHRS